MFCEGKHSVQQTIQAFENEKWRNIMLSVILQEKINL